MAKIDVYDISRNKVSELELNDAVFQVEPKPHLIYEAVKWQLAKKRQGTACTKTRKEVKGGGKKPFRQKGTGRARQGSSRSPIMVGGGTVFGPLPRDYSYALPKKVKKGALRSALSLKLKEARLIVINKIELSQIKTRDLAEIFKRFSVSKGLIVDGDNLHLQKSARNLAHYKYLHENGLNVFDIMKYEYLIVSENSIKSIEGKLNP